MVLEFFFAKDYNLPILDREFISTQTQKRLRNPTRTQTHSTTLFKNALSCDTTIKVDDSSFKYVCNHSIAGRSRWLAIQHEKGDSSTPTPPQKNNTNPPHTRLIKQQNIRLNKQRLSQSGTDPPPSRQIRNGSVVPFSWEVETREEGSGFCFRGGCVDLVGLGLGLVMCRSLGELGSELVRRFTCSSWV